MKVFPHILTRIGGLPFNKIVIPDLYELDDKFQLLSFLEQQQEQAKQQLSDNLLHFNQTIPDKKDQNVIQNFRRDFFNERKIKEGTLKNLQTVLPAALMNEIDAYLESFIMHKQLTIDNLSGLYTSILTTTRSAFQQLSKNEGLRKGFILSSHDLLNGLDDYSTKEISEFRRKELMIENSLYKYVTRSVTKTSPFSTFNNLSHAKIGATSNGIVQYIVDDRFKNRVVSHLRLNNYLFKYLKALLLKIPRVLYKTIIKSNPTIEVEGNNYLFLTNNNNIEAFQRMAIDDINTEVLTIVSATRQGVNFEVLLDKLKEFIDATDDDLIHYIKKLVSYGFLEYNIPVSGVDPEWDFKFIQYLETNYSGSYNFITDTIDTLRSIRSKALQYEKATVQERQSLLLAAFEKYRDLCKQLHAIAGLEFTDKATLVKNKGEKTERKIGEKLETKADDENIAFEHRDSLFFFFKPENIFYEDTQREVIINLNEKAITDVVRNMNDLALALRAFNPKMHEYEGIKTFFLSKYGEEGVVSLLKFYEDFYKEYKKPEAELKKKKQTAGHNKETSPHPVNDSNKEQGTDKNEVTETEAPAPEHSRMEELFQQWKKAFSKLLQEKKITDHSTINISKEDLAACDQDAVLPEHIPSNSFGTFVQFFEEKNATGDIVLKGVINGLFAGYGKAIGRFLHIFDHTLSSDLKQWNQQLSGDKLYLDNCDSSYFNANIHPSIMEYEIQTPGCNNMLESDRQIKVTDLQVRYFKAEDRVQLVHKEQGNVVYAFDLGLQSPNGRSKLFRLVDRLNNAEEIGLSIVARAISDAYLALQNKSFKDNSVLVLPRLVYENNIIIQRKHWFIPKELIPQRDPLMSDFEYYLLINKWRKRLNIMNEVFISVNPYRATVPDAKVVNGKKPGKDDYKPQYINFLNPISMNAFERCIPKILTVLKIEEMLPAPEHLAIIQDDKMVTEYVVQWYRFNN